MVSKIMWLPSLFLLLGWPVISSYRNFRHRGKRSCFSECRPTVWSCNDMFLLKAFCIFVQYLSHEKVKSRNNLQTLCVHHLVWEKRVYKLKLGCDGPFPFNRHSEFRIYLHADFILTHWSTGTHSSLCILKYPITSLDSPGTECCVQSTVCCKILGCLFLGLLCLELWRAFPSVGISFEKDW